MDFQNDLEYQRLQAAIEASAADLENCSNVDYVPQKRRLHMWALADMGDFFYKKGLYSDALPYYTLAKKFDCDETSVLNQMGICLMHLVKIERALYYFEQMCQRTDAPSDKALAWYNISVCYRSHTSKPMLHEAILAMKKSVKHLDNEEGKAILEQLKQLHSTQHYLHARGTLFSSQKRAPNEEQNVLHKHRSPSMAME
ncbi:MAG: hypothetical protein CK424_01610 [Legionella sp.]|nr:MAG: hypothetical protein CK424_01610 [Legionella sp.]